MNGVKHPLELLADWLEARRRIEADPTPFTNWDVHQAEMARIQTDLFNLDPAALRAQSEADAKRKDLLTTTVLTFRRILKADDHGECCEIADWFLTSRAPALLSVGQPTYTRPALSVTEESA